MTTMEAASQSAQTIDAQLKEVLAHFPKITFAMLFGSVALGRQHADSDLIDLKVVLEPLLGQILRHGRRILGSDTLSR